jgi:lipopolysaccharide transport system ATP-binding protein
VLLEVHRNRFGSLEGSLDAVRVADAWGEDCVRFRSGSGVRLEIEYSIPERPDTAYVSATIRRADDLICFDASTAIDAREGRGRVRLDIERIDLARGEYVFDVGIYSHDWARTYDYHFGAYPFSVEGPAAGAGLMAPPSSWHAENMSVLR